jgi:hypothetical protein
VSELEARHHLANGAETRPDGRDELDWAAEPGQLGSLRSGKAPTNAWSSCAYLLNAVRQVDELQRLVAELPHGTIRAITAELQSRQPDG